MPAALPARRPRWASSVVGLAVSSSSITVTGPCLGTPAAASLADSNGLSSRVDADSRWASACLADVAALALLAPALLADADAAAGSADSPVIEMTATTDSAPTMRVDPRRLCKLLMRVRLMAFVR